MTDKTFDGVLAKYLDSMQENVRYLPDDEGSKYLKKRISDLDAMLKKRVKKT